MSEPSLVRDPVVTLDRYAMIGDAGTAALVSDEGSIDWLCLPRFDSDPVFARLLDPEAGHLSVAPVDPFTADRAYVPGTAVLETRYTTAGGRATVHDFFAARDTPAKRRGLTPFRPLIRRIRGETGVVPFVVRVVPRDAFGRGRYVLRARGRLFTADLGGRSLFVHGPGAWVIDGGSATTRFDAAPGETASVSMSYAGRDIGALPYPAALVDGVLSETIGFWRNWTNGAARVAPHPDAVTTSAMVLKLLTFAPSGGIVAAPTTSLPETPGGGRNWDYRYVWIRDASWTARALTSLGYDDEANAYLTWAINAMRTSRPKIRSLYTVYGSSHVGEREVRGLGGYGEARPVRVGNGAVGQRQLDNWGHLVDMAHLWAERRGGLDRDTCEGVSSLVRFVADHWSEPDQGMWEVRTQPKHFVHSKVMAWVALDRGVRLAKRFGLRGPVERWERERDLVKATVLERGIDPETGSFTQAFGSREVDAALLLIGSTGFLEPSDERIVRTIDTVRDRLGHGELIYRYRGPDGVEGDEGAFVACSFWLAEALALAERVDEAREVFEASCVRSNDVGLLAEEVDPVSGAFLGNFPQALSHIALVNAAIAIERADGGPG